MKTHNRNIFHCLTCGNVLHANANVRPPECCGYKMVRAAAETIGDADIAAEKTHENLELAFPGPWDRANPC